MQGCRQWGGGGVGGFRFLIIIVAVALRIISVVDRFLFDAFTSQKAAREGILERFRITLRGFENSKFQEHASTRTPLEFCGQL